jgi:hypothetical protein
VTTPSDPNGPEGKCEKNHQPCDKAIRFFEREIDDVVMKERMFDVNWGQGQAMHLAFSFQKSIDHHSESIVGSPSSQRVHGCHHPHHKESRNSGRPKILPS